MSMRIEFTTSIDDYDFSDIPTKILTVLKENMTSTMFFEKVPVLRYERARDIIDTQRQWYLL